MIRAGRQRTPFKPAPPPLCAREKLNLELSQSAARAVYMREVFFPETMRIRVSLYTSLGKIDVGVVSL